MEAVDQRFGMEEFGRLKVRARLRARPVRQARIKRRWMMARCEKRVVRRRRRRGARVWRERSFRSLDTLPDALKPVFSPPRAVGRMKERRKARR
jgi:hypothetical protein